MQFTPYLNFGGDCRAAFTFYEKALGGSIVAMMTHVESPMAAETPANMQELILHARLIVGEQVLMGSDTPPGTYEKPTGFAVAIGTHSAAEAERVFAALAEGGIVQMPLQQTFWAERFGMLVDRFGIPWMVNCDQPA